MNFDRVKNNKKIIIKIQAKNDLEIRMNSIKTPIIIFKKPKKIKGFHHLLEGISLEILKVKNRDKAHKCIKMNKKLFLWLILKISVNKKNLKQKNHYSLILFLPIPKKKYSFKTKLIKTFSKVIIRGKLI